MIDNFALALTHLLMLVAAWRPLKRPDLDREDGAEIAVRFGRKTEPTPMHDLPFLPSSA